MAIREHEQQAQVLGHQFVQVERAFASKRVRLERDQASEIDPELVLVFDLPGTIEGFRNAVDKIEGLEFLADYLPEALDPDPDDAIDGDGGNAQAEPSPGQSIYAVWSNVKAANQLIELFRLWREDKSTPFPRGLTPFRHAFDLVSEVRNWDASDRIRETGLLESWYEKIEVYGQTKHSVLAEVELWYRADSGARNRAEEKLRTVADSFNGTVVSAAQIEAIRYHALLLSIPIQNVSEFLAAGIENIDLFNTDEVMFLSPHLPMTVSVPVVDAATLAPSRRAETRLTTKPLVALLDGLPFTNHDLLLGRLVVDDPDDLTPDYPIGSRSHGTAMASLILHGDLSSDEPLPSRPVYVRPILEPMSRFPDCERERVIENRLFVDLLHEAIITVRLFRFQSQTPYGPTPPNSWHGATSGAPRSPVASCHPVMQSTP